MPSPVATVNPAPARPITSRLSEIFLSRQSLVFILSACAVLALLGNLIMTVPVMIPMQPDNNDQRYWPVALAAGLIVAAVYLTVAGAAVRRREKLAVPGEGAAYESPFPGPLKIEVAPMWVVAATAGVSLTAFLVMLSRSMPDWQIALGMLLPWLPVLAVETWYRWRLDGFFAMFLVVSLLQTGHLGEHTAQVMELVVHNGNLDKSHGIFGQLDFETVHFFWDMAIWLTAAALLFRYPGNGWLWVSFTFASLHQVEHIYLYFVFLADYTYYMAGGLAGLMGKGGVIGSPLFRPYLHFFYNFLVTVPMLIGLWMQHPPREPGPEPLATPD